MRDKLHAYLLERPSGATARELLDLIFTRPGNDAELGPRLLETMLAGDGRFAFQADTQQWIATRHAVLQRGLDETSFVIVDLEATCWERDPPFPHEVIEIGQFRPAPTPCDQLVTGQVGYFMAQIKNITDVHIGDTVTEGANPTAEPLPGYKEPKPMVFSGLYPTNSNDFENLREALAKLRLNDSSFVYQPEVS